MNESPSRLGAIFPAAADPAELPRFAALVEQLGFDALWLVEDCFLSGGLTMAATALAVTHRITVGLGLMPSTVRNPAIAAMEVATLANIHPGRFELALGHGVDIWMKQIGSLPVRRLVALEESVTSIRQLLAGQVVTIRGDNVSLSEVVLGRPPAVVPPVLVGTTGPKGLALADRSSDGILLPEGCGPDFIRWSLGQMQSAPAARCLVYAWLSIDDDPLRAREHLAPNIDDWLDHTLYPFPQRVAGVTDAVSTTNAARAALIDQLAICGDPKQCAQRVGQFAAAGADTIILMPPADLSEPQLATFAAEVMPLMALP